MRGNGKGREQSVKEESVTKQRKKNAYTLQKINVKKKTCLKQASQMMLYDTNGYTKHQPLLIK